MLHNVRQGTEDTAEVLQQRAKMVNQRCEGQVEYHCRAAE